MIRKSAGKGVETILTEPFDGHIRYPGKRLVDKVKGKDKEEDSELSTTTESAFVGNSIMNILFFDIYFTQTIR